MGQGWDGAVDRADGGHHHSRQAHELNVDADATANVDVNGNMNVDVDWTKRDKRRVCAWGAKCYGCKSYKWQTKHEMEDVRLTTDDGRRKMRTRQKMREMQKEWDGEWMV